MPVEFGSGGGLGYGNQLASVDVVFGSRHGTALDQGVVGTNQHENDGSMLMFVTGVRRQPGKAVASGDNDRVFLRRAMLETKWNFG